MLSPPTCAKRRSSSQHLRACLSFCGPATHAPGLIIGVCVPYRCDARVHQVLSARVLRPIGEDEKGDAILVEMFGGGVGDWAEVELAFEIEMKRASRTVLFKVVHPPPSTLAAPTKTPGP